MSVKKNISYLTRLGLFLSVIIFIVQACSTEKNTFVNRAYHSVTAKYNGLFNANQLLLQGLDDYRRNTRENFNEIIAVELFPNEEDVVNFYPIVDTAIAKCEEVISKHSMPTASKPSQKNTEHARWIDQNWMTIGRAQFLRREYEKALKTFKYVKEFFIDRPSTFSGQLWMAKTHIKLGDLSKATQILTELNARVLGAAHSGSSEDDEKSGNAKPPKHFKREVARAEAILALKKENYPKAIEELKVVLENTRKNEKEARISFIIGQIYQQLDDPKARKYYSISIKKNAPFAMRFHAKVNRSVVSDLNKGELIKELNKLTKEEKYLEFRDQVYYAMAKIELKHDNKKEAKEHLSQSVFYSINNNLQKGISYETLGDLYFEEKNYVFAQRYYDSSSQVIPESYSKAPVIKNKAEKLGELVEHIDVITYEDSVQKIALLGEKERIKFIKDVIKQLQKEAEERRKRKAIRAAQLRELQRQNQSSKSGRNFYFSNPDAMQKGFEDFRTRWGQRKNEDYWRLSTKPIRFQMQLEQEQNIADSIAKDSLAEIGEPETIPVDSLTVEDLLVAIPLTDSALQVSNEKLIAALYGSGRIYRAQLDEPELASHQFQRIVDKNYESKFNPMAAFQLYQIYEGSSKSNPYKEYILTHYPSTDYANYLRDPDYFVKKKERDALAVKEYTRSVDNFKMGLYYPVILKAKKVISDEPKNSYRKYYMLLQAKAMGKIYDDKTKLLPVLNQAIEEYPESEVAARAKELIDLIKNGVPEVEKIIDQVDLFTFEADELYVLITLAKNQDARKSSMYISNYNRIYFRRLELQSMDQIYNKDTTFILIKSFNTSVGAEEYIGDITQTKRYQMNFPDNEVLIISRKNLKTVLQQHKLTAYRKFYNSIFK